MCSSDLAGIGRIHKAAFVEGLRNRFGRAVYIGLSDLDGGISPAVFLFSGMVSNVEKPSVIRIGRAQANK